LTIFEEFDMVINQSQVKDLVIDTVASARLRTAEGKISYITETKSWYYGMPSGESDDGNWYIDTAQLGIAWVKIGNSEKFQGFWSEFYQYKPDQFVLHNDKLYHTAVDVAPGKEPGIAPEWFLVLGDTSLKTFDPDSAFTAGTHFKDGTRIFLLLEDYSPLPTPSTLDELITDNKVLRLGGGEGGVKVWVAADSYSQNQTVTHMGGLFAANSDIPAGTAFAIHSIDDNTWRPMSGGLWYYDIAVPVQIMGAVGGMTFVRSPNLLNSMIVSDTQLNMYFATKPVFKADATDGTVISGPTTESPKVKINGNNAVVTNAAGADVVVITDGGTDLRSPTANKCRVAIADSNVAIFTPNSAGTAFAKFVATINETTLRGPLATNNNTFTLGNGGRSTLTVAGIDKLDVSTTLSTFAFNTTNKVDLSDNAFKLKLNNIDRTVVDATTTGLYSPAATSKTTLTDAGFSLVTDTSKVRLDIGNSYSAIQSGASNLTSLVLTGDATADLKVNNVTKIKLSNVSDNEFCRDTANKLWLNTATLGLKCRGYDVLSTGGSGSEYLYLKSPSLTSTTGRLNLGPSVIQGTIGSAEKFKIDDTESVLKFGGNNFVSIGANRFYAQVSGTNRLDISPDNNYARYGFDTLTYMETWGSGCKLRTGAQDRIWCNDTNSTMCSPGLEKRFEANDTHVKMTFNATNFCWVNTNGFYAQKDAKNWFYHNGSFIVHVNGATKLNVGSSLTKMTQSLEIEGSITPKDNNNVQLGTTALRWRTVCTVNFDQSSDATLKENPEALPDALLDAWGVHVHPKQYNWIDKQTSDKKHIGFIAQDIIAAFDAAGLDWRGYGIISGDGVEVKFGVSYTDAHVIETAYQRRLQHRNQLEMSELRKSTQLEISELKALIAELKK
jgi:hypothetical protein